MTTNLKESYDRLSKRIALTVITVSMAPLILVGGLIFDQFRSIYHERVYAHLAEMVDKHKANIDTFLKDKLHEVQYLNAAHSYDQLTDTDQLETILKDMQRQFGRIIVDVGIVDEGGILISYAGPYDLLGADYSEADWYIKSRGRRSGISDVFLGLRNTPHFIITVNNDDDGRKWTLRATIDFLAFSSMVENIRIGKTGYAYIINSDGEFQTTHTPSRHSQHSLNPTRGYRHPMIVEGVSIYDATDQDGEDYITVAARLDNVDWELVYQQIRSDAFSDMNRSEIFTLIIFMIGGLGIFIMAFVISRKIVKKFQLIDVKSQIMNKQMVETGKLASIGELASSVAHEINNPVAIMIEEAGWVQDLMEDMEDDINNRDEIDRALIQIRNQGKRCKDITHKLLSFARQTDGHVTEVELPMLIEEVVNLSIQQARYAQVNFEMDIDHSLPAICGSTTELQQVFLNLVNNSIQAMEHEGGTITISCQRDGDWIRTTVADTGPGIPAANLKRIFDPFFTTKPVGKGTGLGLSICFGIIHQMGGEIEVESTVGEGTAFIIRLPLSENEQ